jgi:hypothetical protein
MRKTSFVEVPFMPGYVFRLKPREDELWVRGRKD